MRVINVSRPGSRSGSKRLIKVRASSTVDLGPSFTPIGFLIFEAKSICAPSSWRVRSPIHTKCADTSYGSPVRESIRVNAFSYSKISASWLEKKSTDLNASGSTPADFMKSSARPISLAISS